MSKRSAWCEPSKELRKDILKRDGHKCIFCDEKTSLTMVHVFLSRAHGGKACKENLCTGCIKCHYYTLDNPLYEKNNLKSQQMMAKARTYLIEKEFIVFGKAFMDSLKFKKEITYTPIISVKVENRCEDCKFIRRDKFNNSTIPSYYCVVKRKIIGRKNESCMDFKKEVISNGKNDINTL